MNTESKPERLQDIDDAVENELLERKLELLDMRLNELTAAYDDLTLGIDWFMHTVENVIGSGFSQFETVAVFKLCRNHFRKVQLRADSNFIRPDDQPELPFPLDDLPF